MNTHCTSQQLLFQPCGSRKVVANFDAGRVSSDAGLLLLSELDARIGIIRRFAECFTDHRTQGSIEHPVVDLLCQRILALCAGYEDLNDHDTLRGDALFAAAVGKADVTGAQRMRERDKGHPLAGKSTLNRKCQKQVLKDNIGLLEPSAGDHLPAEDNDASLRRR